MSAPAWLAAMVAGTVVVLVAGRRPVPAPPPPARPSAVETPWLTPEAAAEVIRPDGTPGPLFTGILIGGTPPLPEVRARIDAFARENNVAIAIEVVNDEVAAIRFDVTYGGCCGYEAVDRLALRLDRPTSGGGCSSLPVMWVNEWARTVEDGVQMRARVRINRLRVSWERIATLPELLDRAERLLGASDAAVRREARDREPARRYRLEVPYPLRDIHGHDDLWIHLRSDGHRITEVSFEIHPPFGWLNHLRATLRDRWGTRNWQEANGRVTVTLR